MVAIMRLLPKVVKDTNLSHDHLLIRVPTWECEQDLKVSFEEHSHFIHVFLLVVLKCLYEKNMIGISFGWGRK